MDNKVKSSLNQIFFIILIIGVFLVVPSALASHDISVPSWDSPTAKMLPKQAELPDGLSMGIENYDIPHNLLAEKWGFDKTDFGYSRGDVEYFVDITKNAEDVDISIPDRFSRISSEQLSSACDGGYYVMNDGDYHIVILCYVDDFWFRVMTVDGNANLEQGIKDEIVLINLIGYKINQNLFDKTSSSKISVNTDDDTKILLPTRDEIGTIWKYPTNQRVYDEIKDPETKSGLIEYTWRGHMKGSGYETNFLDLYIYRFESPANSKELFDDHVDYLKNKGGYSEWSPELFPKADECYGRITTGTVADKVSLYCVKDDILIIALGAGFEFEMKDEVTKFVSAVVKKIEQSKTMKDTPKHEVGLEPKSVIPEWIKNIFAWYSQGKVSDDELIKALQFLIKEGIIRIQ